MLCFRFLQCILPTVCFAGRLAFRQFFLDDFHQQDYLGRRFGELLFGADYLRTGLPLAVIWLAAAAEKAGLNLH